MMDAPASIPRDINALGCLLLDLDQEEVARTGTEMGGGKGLLLGGGFRRGLRLRMVGGRGRIGLVVHLQVGEGGEEGMGMMMARADWHKRFLEC